MPIEFVPAADGSVPRYAFNGFLFLHADLEVEFQHVTIAIQKLRELVTPNGG
jgi:hypothetical protein